jgi:formate dehydrogenase subunit gamma
VSASTQVLRFGRILRYTFRERATHWLAAFSYIYLLLSGLAFYSPSLFWLADILGGGQLARTLHPWFGLIFTGAVIFMYVMWAGQMRMTDTDKAWWGSLQHYVRNEDDKMPPAGRYNAGQKLLFWGFFVCGLLLLLSGLLLWFPEYIPWNLRYLRYIAVLVHVPAALITIGLFMIHIYMSVFAERGAFSSVINGDVSVEFAKRYHPAWYEEVVRSSTPRSPAPRSSTPRR